MPARKARILTVKSPTPMEQTRRTFILTGAATCSALAVSPKLFGAGSEQKTTPPQCLDYGMSFVCNTASFNSVRMWIESRTTIIDPKAGTRTEYYQCGSCKSENTFAERDLFKQDNYDFLPIFGDGQVLIFRRHASVTPSYRQVRKQEEVWGSTNLKLREPKNITELDTWEKVRDANAAGLPIVTQTELRNSKTGLRAIIECPVKTMNVSLDDRKYQTDTGPIAFPDLGKPYNPQIECLNLAYIAFNTASSADFVVEDETPILADGKKVSSVFHYSKILSLPATNRILSIGQQ